MPISGEAIEQMVSTAAKLHGNPQILAALEDAATSCVKWGNALQLLFVEESLDMLYIRDKPGKAIQIQDFAKIERDLKRGRAIFVQVKLPGSTDHVFTIIGGEGRARILHAWQNCHGIRPERSMPIKEMVSLLKKLPTYDYTITDDVAKVCEVRKRLWGADHAGSGDIGTSSRKRISFNAIMSGTPKKPLIECKETLGRLSIELSEWHSVSSIASTECHAAVSGRTSTGRPSFEETSGAHGVIRIRYAAGFGAALGFMLGASGALWFDKYADWDLEEGLKVGLAMGTGEGVGAAIAKSVKPTFDRVGISVVRANAAAGAAMFSVFALWDVAKWAKHDITAVKLRQNLAEAAGGAAGSVVVGALTGALGGAAFGPPGAVVGSIVGALGGGIGGSFAGKAIDERIWDEGEDSVMNSYEFFEWHDVGRFTRPIKSAKAIKKAYLEKLETNPSNKVKRKDWDTYCTANLMVLLRAMIPELKEMLEISDYVRKNITNGVSIIGKTMYSSSLPMDSETPSVMSSPRIMALPVTYRGPNPEERACWFCFVKCCYYCCCWCCCRLCG